jgi:hypothetical protein
MALSPIEMGALLDSWVETGRANVVETQAAITIYNLAVDRVVELDGATKPDWSVELVDGAMQPSDVNSLDDHMGPYIVTIHKPVETADVRVLTRAGFLQALESLDVSGVWQVACAGNSFATGFASFNPWGRGDVYVCAAPTKSPLELVREGAEKRIVPADIRKWLLRSPITDTLWQDNAFQSFAGARNRAACPEPRN